MKQSTVVIGIGVGLAVYVMTRQGGVVSLPTAPAMPEIKMPEIVVNVPTATGAGGQGMQDYLDVLQDILRDALRSRSTPGPTGGSYTAPPGTPTNVPPPGAPVNPPTEGNPWGIPPGDVWSYPRVSSRAASKAGNTQASINQLQEALARLGEQVGASWNRTTGAVPHQLAPPSLQGTRAGEPFSDAFRGIFQPLIPEGLPKVTDVLAPWTAKLSEVLPGLGEALGPLQDAFGGLPERLEGLKPGKRGVEMPFTGWEMPFTGWEAPKPWDPGWWLRAPEFKIPSFLR